MDASRYGIPDTTIRTIKMKPSTYIQYIDGLSNYPQFIACVRFHVTDPSCRLAL